MNATTPATRSTRLGLYCLTLLAAMLLAFVPRPASATLHQVPFSAAFDTEFQAVVEFPTAHISVAGPGHALHMGGSTAVSTNQEVDLTTGQGTATYTLTAANGDTVVLEIEFATTFQPTGEVTFEGTYTVTGGTGRFAGATGAGSASGSAIFTGPTGGIGSFSIDGTISRRGN